MAVPIPQASSIGLDLPSAPGGFQRIDAPSISNVFGPALDKVAQVADAIAEDGARTAALGAENEARAALHSILYDPKTGYTTSVRGKAAVDGLKGLQEQIGKSIDASGGNLTGLARRMYDRSAQNLRLEVARTASAHAGKELDAYETGEFNKMVELQAQAKLVNPDADVRPDFDGWVKNRADKMGLGPEARAAFEATAFGQVAEAHVRGLLNSGRTGEAAAVFDNYSKGGRMTAQQVAALGGLVKHQTDFDMGQGIADEVWQSFSAGGMTLVQAEKQLREKAKGNKDAFAAANAAFREFKQAQDTDDQIAQGRVMKAFTDIEVSQGAAAAYRAIVKTNPDFRNLAPRLFADVENWMRSQVEHAETRARVGKAEAEEAKANDPETLELMSTLTTTPGMLARMDPYQIEFLRSKIGNRNVAALQAIRRETNGVAAGFRLTDDHATKYPLSGYTGNTESDKAVRKAYQNLADYELIQWKASHPGAVPGEKDIMGFYQSAARQVSTPGVIYGENLIPAAVAAKAGKAVIGDYAFPTRPNGAVVVDKVEMDRGFLEGMNSAYRARYGRNPTRDELLKLWQNRRTK